jgi:DUF218 domain
MIRYFLHSKGSQKAYAHACKIKPLDAIIVPGIPFYAPEWNVIMKHRVLWSYVLYRDGITKNIIYSGAAVYTPFIEATIMGLYAEALGVPKEHIFLETQARHSTENVYYAYLIAQQQQFKSLGLATDPVQSYMLQRFTKKRCLSSILHIPSMSHLLADVQHLNPIINPESARINNFTSIVQSEPLSKRLLGTLGKGIDWRKHPNGKLSPL